MNTLHVFLLHLFLDFVLPSSCCSRQVVLVQRNEFFDFWSFYPVYSIAVTFPRMLVASMLSSAMDPLPLALHPRFPIFEAISPLPASRSHNPFYPSFKVFPHPRFDREWMLCLRWDTFRVLYQEWSQSIMHQLILPRTRQSTQSLFQHREFVVKLRNTEFFCYLLEIVR